MRATRRKAIGIFVQLFCLGALRRRDANGVGAAGADRATGAGLADFIQADFDGSEVVVTAAEGK